MYKFDVFSQKVGDVTAYLQGKEKMPRAVLLEKYKAIYVPIPKVACTSLLITCAELLDMGDSNTYLTNDSIHRTYFPCARPPRRSASKDSLFFKRNYEGYFKFAFVRNPWARLVSCYRNKIDSPSLEWLRNNSSTRAVFDKDISFDTFARAIAEVPDESAEKHFRSQYTFLTDTHGELVTSFIGKFESMDMDLSHVFAHLGLANRKILHAMKSSSNKESYRTYYSDELKDIIHDRYAKDIKLFEYSF